MELLELLQKWERIAEKVTWQRDWHFRNEEQRDRIISYLEGESHECLEFDDHIDDFGWSIIDWPEKLKGIDPKEDAREELAELMHEESVTRDPSEEQAARSDEDDYGHYLCDMGMAEIILKANEQFPHVDTTPFVVFYQAALATLADEVSEYDSYRLPGKPQLQEAFKHALPVSYRLKILLGFIPPYDPRGDLPLRQSYLNIETNLLKISRPGHDPVGLSPHEMGLVNALIKAGPEGVNFHDLIPEVATNEDNLRNYCYTAGPKLLRLNLRVKLERGTWTLKEATK